MITLLTYAAIAGGILFALKVIWEIKSPFKSLKEFYFQYWLSLVEVFKLAVGDVKAVFNKEK